ncbi:MAG: glycosyltransferase family 39 protein, partial [Chloroflexota bacterium]|nr:glycosyltransferase family 39 protein [Chloroflexota bacterium]
MGVVHLRGRWALSALGLALLGQLSIEGARDERSAAPPVLGGILFFAAALMLVWGSRGTWNVESTLPSARTLAAVAVGSTRRGWLLCLAGASLCAVAAVPLFWQLNARDPHGPAADWPVNTGSWLLYLSALLLFGLAFVLKERAEPGHATAVTAIVVSGGMLSHRRELALVGGLTVLALLLRVVDLEHAPPGLWFDEAQNGIVGRGLVAPGAAHLTFIGDYTQMGALYFYFVGLCVRIFGNFAWSVRLVPALSGTLLVPLLYLLASRLYGWRTGLGAAGLVAISAWNITFSRYGVDVLPSVTLDVALYLCLLQGLRSGRAGYFAGAGVLLGLNLQMYYIARLAPVVILIMLVRLLPPVLAATVGRFATLRGRSPVRPRPQEASQGNFDIAAVGRRALTFLAGAGLAFLPVALFAVEQPALFNQRVDTVSIFRPDIRAQHPDLLRSNVTEHLLMFNWVGDNNPKQNLPGAPMLDWVSAALFATGAVICLLRLRRWQYFFPLVWLSVSITGGVLSIDAPHSQRTIENSAVAALIGGIFLGEVWQLLTLAMPAHSSHRAWRILGGSAVVSTLGIAACVAAAGGFSIYRYFGQQISDRSVWWEMNAPEAQA